MSEEEIPPGTPGIIPIMETGFHKHIEPGRDRFEQIKEHLLNIHHQLMEDGRSWDDPPELWFSIEKPFFAGADRVEIFSVIDGISKKFSESRITDECTLGPHEDIDTWDAVRCFAIINAHPMDVMENISPAPKGFGAVMILEAWTFQGTKEEVERLKPVGWSGSIADHPLGKEGRQIFYAAPTGEFIGVLAVRDDPNIISFIIRADGTSDIAGATHEGRVLDALRHFMRNNRNEKDDDLSHSARAGRTYL